jgi:cell division protein FtsW (lipid II flippase)
MGIWRRKRDRRGPEGVALHVRRPSQPAGAAGPTDIRPRAGATGSSRIPTILLAGLALAATFYVLAHIAVIRGVWPIHGTSPGAAATLARDGAALVGWLAVFPILRALGYRGNWAVVALPVIIFLLIRPTLFQLFTDPAYQATRGTRAEANALKAERSQITTLLRAYEEPRQEIVFGGTVPELPDPWRATRDVERETGWVVRMLSYGSVLVAPIALLLGFVAARSPPRLRWVRERRVWPFALTLAVFFTLTLFFTELGKVRGTTPWELLMPVFVFAWAAVLADDAYNFARPSGIVAPRRAGVLLLYGAIPIVPFLVIRELGLSIVLAGTLAVMLLVGTRRGWWAGLMLAVWAVLVLAAFNLDHRSATRLALAYSPYRPVAEMTQPEAERWAASVHQIKLFDANVLAGGFLGRGPGRGHAETAPNAADDGYITAVAAQYGLIGTFAFILLYTMFLIQMIAVGIRERGAFERTLVVGLALLIAIPFWLATLGGVRVIPLTGVAAAFAAHGGAKLLASAVSVGVIAAISHAREVADRVAEQVSPEGDTGKGVRVI